MKLQNYQTKFLYADFVSNVVEQAVSRMSRTDFSRPAVVRDHTTFRFFYHKLFRYLFTIS